MGVGTKIEWTRISWSPWWGCTKVSVGEKGACELCYAEALDKRTGGDHWGPGKPRRELSAKHWGMPLRWNAEAQAAGERWTVFPSMCDPFDNEVPIEWLQRFVDLIEATPNLIWLLLTKRPQNIQKRLSQAERTLPRNVALGATVVTQKEADRDIPWLLGAAELLGCETTFVSCEPLQEQINLYLSTRAIGGSRIGWVISGGESGGKARPSHPAWHRSLRDQCAAAGVPFLFKQWGEWAPVCEIGDTDELYHPAPVRDPEATRRCKVDRLVIRNDGALYRVSQPLAFAAGFGGMTVFRIGKARAGRLLDGVEHNEFPASFGKAA